MKKAVMYGGGNIGRGFIGATLSQSGYEVTFIDVAEPVVKALQEKHQYPVRYVSSEGYEDIMIEHVTAVNGNDQEAASGYQIKGSGILYWGEITYTGSDGIHGRSGAGGISGTGERAVGRVSS